MSKSACPRSIRLAAMSPRDSVHFRRVTRSVHRRNRRGWRCLDKGAATFSPKRTGSYARRVAGYPRRCWTRSMPGVRRGAVRIWFSMIWLNPKWAETNLLRSTDIPGQSPCQAVLLPLYRLYRALRIQDAFDSGQVRNEESEESCGSAILDAWSHGGACKSGWLAIRHHRCNHGKEDERLCQPNLPTEPAASWRLESRGPH
jgi:hypothetical protein